MTELWRGAAKPLDPWDPGVLALAVGLTEDHVKAIMAVEAAGSGFDKAGRVKMLFEPHVFWRELSRKTVVKGKTVYRATPARDRAEAEGLAYAEWGAKPYPKDSYPRLAKALAIDERAALRSASWGAGQIMGQHHAMLGYVTPREMVAAFAADEEAHVRGMVTFIRKSGLADEARRGDWAGFARGYNGPGYKKNGYDRKLAKAFARYQAEPDTPLPETLQAKPAPAGAPPAETPSKEGPDTGESDDIAAPAPERFGVPAVVGAGGVAALLGGQGPLTWLGLALVALAIGFIVVSLLRKGYSS